MSLPNMGDVLSAWEKPHLIKAVTLTTVDFVETEIVVGRTQNCVVQVAEKEKLNSETIDWALEYLMIHSKLDIEIGEYIEYKGRDFKVISRGPWEDYGYTEVFAEETKRPLKVVT
jgi:hypothetical protein